MTDEEIKRLEQELLAKVPDEGRKGNIKLIRELNWPDEDTYWFIRDRLVDDGKLETARGKGGSVSRVRLAPSPEYDLEDSAQPTHESEADLYPKLLSVLQSKWAKDSRADQVHVEITGQQGSRSTGKWARPDITAITYRVFPYVSGKQIETVTFEVKPSWAIDVTSVYEALGHRRAAHRAYVILVHQRPADIEERLLEVYAEARKFGIGVIVATDPSRYEDWEIVVEATRHDPDPARLNEFLAGQVSQILRDTLMKWFK